MAAGIWLRRIPAAKHEAGPPQAAAGVACGHGAGTSPADGAGAPGSAAAASAPASGSMPLSALLGARMELAVACTFAVRLDEPAHAQVRAARR